MIMGAIAGGWTRLSSIRMGKSALIAAPLAIVAIMLTVTFIPGKHAGNALAAALRDPMSMFAARSPGQRPAGALTRTKKRLVAAGTAAPAPGAALPTERVLSTGRTRPVDVAGGAPVAAAPGLLVLPADAAPLAAVAPVAVAPAAGVPGNGGFIGGVGPALPGVGGSAPIGIPPIAEVDTPPITPGPVVTTPVPEVTAPVPEPSTWISMIVGLAFVGFALRRRGVRTASRRTERRDAA